MRFRNIFVLSAGRTATTTFSNSAKFINGVTSEHESRVQMEFANRLSYPRNHIESDNRLIFYLPLLARNYGKDAAYVYLIRDEKAVALSYSKRWYLRISIVRAFTQGVRMIPRVRSKEIYDNCLEYVTYVDAIINTHMENQEHIFYFNMSDSKNEFQRFCTWADCGEAPAKSLAEWDEFHNMNSKNSFLNFIKTKFRLMFG